MSAYPLMLEGSAISAVVVGGGNVAARKTRGLLDSGARVEVVSPTFVDDLRRWNEQEPRLTLTTGTYTDARLDGCLFVVAATNDAAVNGHVAEDARARGLLVNVVSDPGLGNCTTAAVHRAGDVVIAVSTGRVPSAAMRIRERLARTFDGRYGDAVIQLAQLRRAYLDRGERERWAATVAALAGPGFCDDVESGAFAARLAEWR